MRKWQTDILDLLLEAETVSVPELQKRLGMTYDKARETVSFLQQDGLVDYVGGIAYSVNADKVKDARDESDMTSYIARRREELLKRLQESEEADEDAPDEDEEDDLDEEEDEFDDDSDDEYEDDLDEDDEDDFDDDEALLRRLYLSEHKDDEENADKDGDAKVGDGKDDGGGNENSDEGQDTFEDETRRYIVERRKQLLERLERIWEEREAKAEEEDSASDDYEEDPDDNDGDEELDENDVDAEEREDEDNPLRKVYDDIAEERRGLHTWDVIDDETSGYLTPNAMMYECKRAYYTRIHAAYKEKSRDKLVSLPTEEIRALEARLAPCLTLDKVQTANSGGIQAFFLSDLFLPDGVCYAPSITMNEHGEYFLHHPLIDSAEESKLGIRQEFYMLLKRHGMFFGDGTLVKQFLRLSDAMPATMELYAALSEAKIIIDRM